MSDHDDPAPPQNDPRTPTGSVVHRPWLGWAVFGGVMLMVFLLAMLGASIVERRGEARVDQDHIEIGDLEVDSEVWGVNHPRQYGSWKQQEISDTLTKYGGAVPRDYLEERPANVILFAGYGFAKDYLQARGHTHSIEDINNTLRTGAKTPGTCWTCKSTDVPRLMEEMGPAEFYATKWVDLKDEVTHSIGCLDCHDPDTMALRITRPALIEAFERNGEDITQATHQEMRSLVCAQCHVEYYFKGDGKYLTFPWDEGDLDEGMSVEGMAAYYEKADFHDWTHAISKAPMVKMQHPDYEIYTKGIHHYRDVSCADCHMPYRSEGGAKFTDHHIRSPLLNIENSCAVCHRWGEDEIRERVEGIQDKVSQARHLAEAVLSKAHFDIAACMQVGASEEELDGLRTIVSQAQLRWDYVAATNGMGFHAPQECQRILGEATSLAQDCRVAAARILASHGYTQPVAYPDYDGKDIAQALIQRFIDGDPPSLLAGQ